MACLVSFLKLFLFLSLSNLNERLFSQFSYVKLFVTNPGALKIFLFRVAFFIHRIASPKGRSGEFLDTEMSNFNHVIVQGLFTTQGGLFHPE